MNFKKNRLDQIAWWFLLLTWCAIDIFVSSMKKMSKLVIVISTTLKNVSPQLYAFKMNVVYISPDISILRSSTIKFSKFKHEEPIWHRIHQINILEKSVKTQTQFLIDSCRTDETLHMTIHWNDRFCNFCLEIKWLYRAVYNQVLIGKFRVKTMCSIEALDQLKDD